MSLTIEQKIEVLDFYYPNTSRVVDDSTIPPTINWPEGQPATDVQLESSYATMQLDKAKIAKKKELDYIRYQLSNGGMEWNFNGVTDVVQTRDEDKLLLLSMYSKAKSLIDSGITDAVQIFRAESNNSYWITPQEAHDMSLQAALYIENLYITSWSLKDQVNNATTLQEISNITWPV